MDHPWTPKTETNDACQKPFGDPDNDTIAIKASKPFEPADLVGMPFIMAVHLINASGNICYRIKHGENQDDLTRTELSLKPVFIVVNGDIVTHSSMSWRIALGLGTDGLNGDWPSRQKTPQEMHAEIALQQNRDWLQSQAKTKTGMSYPVGSGVPNSYPLSINTPLGAGVPNQYPIAINTPLDRAYLRPLQQPLYDTEWFVPGKAIKLLPFFKNPKEYETLKSTYEFLSEAKTMHDTNMDLPGSLSYPIEHSVLGFNAIIDPKTSQEDRDSLLSNGAMVEFKFSGNRPYLSIPFEHICAKRSNDKSTSQVLSERELILVGSAPKKDDQPTQEEIENAALLKTAVKLLEKASGKNYYPFNLGKSALKIKPGEQFSMTLSWKKTPLVSRPVRIIMEIIGLRWAPL